MRLAMALLLLTTLTGCTVKYDLSGADWTKSGVMLPQTTQDEMDCVRVSREAGWTPDLVLGGVFDIARWTIEDQQRLGSYKRCMVAKGYQPS
jgi:hypothetical protein